MKRIIAVFLVVVMIIAVTTAVCAITADEDNGKRLLKKGYTEQDLDEINAIVALSDEGVISFIVQKYESLGDWQKVREAYNIDETEYENYKKTQAEWKAILDRIPEEFMNAMKKDMNRNEINYFINQLNLMDIDFDYAWQQYKAGKTAKEIIAEKVEQRKKQSEANTMYVMGEISTEEYLKTVASITDGDEATIGKILSEVQKLRTEVRNRHKIQSGISEQEIEYCMSQGMTNPMDMFQAKYISKTNNIQFDKVVASQLKNNDWITTAAEVLNIPLEEYKKQVEQLIKK